MRDIRSLTIRCAGAITLSLLVGCSKQRPAAANQPAAQSDPKRPTITPPPFKIFHQDGSTFTLVTEEGATDDEIVALIYELRDAAHTNGFDALHISQKAVDARDPYAWFHIYRGSKCAAEKYVPKPPCGASYHAAGDYSFGGLRRKDWDDGILIHGQDNETHLWNPDGPYQPTH